MRRIIFVISILLFGAYNLSQLAIAIMLSFTSLLYLLKYRPLKTNLANNKEIFNEATVFILSYLALGFTDAEHNPLNRSILGRCFLCLSMGNILVNFVILFAETIAKLFKFIKQTIKKCTTKSTKNNIQKLGV